MGVFDFFKKAKAMEPARVSRDLRADIAARREANPGEEATETDPAFEAELRREAWERQEMLAHLQEALYRCLGVDATPDGNPVLVDGLWFLEEKVVNRGAAFWLLHFCYPCQNCGELTKAVRLEHVSPYEDPPEGNELPAVQEHALQEIAAFLDRVESGKKRFLCPDCKLEEKPA
jgi:hypothetical protein